MGGERETQVKSKPAGKSGSTEVSSIRIHESGGEVHFHDDKRKLKVAVPVATWYEAMSLLLGQSPSDAWTYVDPVQNTALEATLVVDDNKKKPVFDISLEITAIELADDLAKLLKFTHGS